VIRENRMVELHHFDGADAESFLLETAEHLANDVFADGIRLEKDQRGFR
jgi:hypothetical protein